MIDCGVLEFTEHVTLSNTSVTKESLYLLQEGSMINKLRVDSNVIKLTDLKPFKSNMPDCYVELNSEEVLT